MHYTTPEVYKFISKQTNDQIVERKTCRISDQSFAIYQSDLEFYDKISPIFNDKKYSIPTPTLCPEERQRRRLLFRNERKLYKRKCDATGEDIISVYSPDKPDKVYKQDFWNSDKWNKMEYGKQLDKKQSFFDQYKSLKEIVPKSNLDGISNENSDYTNFTDHCKNSYLCFFSNNLENCRYSHGSEYMNNSSDIIRSSQVDNSYDCFSCA